MHFQNYCQVVIREFNFQLAWHVCTMPTNAILNAISTYEET